MTVYEVVETTYAHVAELSETMRMEDRAELWAATHLEPLDGLFVALRYTDVPYTGLADGGVLCIFGLGRNTLLSQMGKPWMLSSELVRDHPRAWARGSRQAFRDMQTTGPLENYVDARYSVAVRWLAWLGFTLHSPEPYGLDQLPFHRFTWEPAHG